MSRLKLILRIGGVIVVLVGLMFLPVGYGNSPKRDLSVFHNIADMGSFIKTGFLLVGLGLIAVVLSFLLPGEMDEDYWG